MAITIRAARANLGLSQAEAAEKLGISVDKLFAWEKQKRLPDAKEIARIIELYGIPYDQLIFFDD